jgi:hypothetical protein
VEDLDNLPICSVRTHTDIEFDPEKKIPPNIGKQACTLSRTDSDLDDLEKYDNRENKADDEGTTNVSNLINTCSITIIFLTLPSPFDVKMSGEQ